MLILATATTIILSDALTRQHSVTERVEYCSAAEANRVRGIIPYCQPMELQILHIDGFNGQQDPLLSTDEKKFLLSVLDDVESRSLSGSNKGCYGTGYRDCLASASQSFRLTSGSIWPIPETQATQYDSIYSSAYDLTFSKNLKTSAVRTVPAVELRMFVDRRMTVTDLTIKFTWDEGLPSIDSIMASGAEVLFKDLIPSCRPVDGIALARQIKAATNPLWMEHLSLGDDTTSDRGVARICGKLLFVSLNHWTNEQIVLDVGTKSSDIIERKAGLGGLTRQPVSRVAAGKQ